MVFNMRNTFNKIKTKGKQTKIICGYEYVKIRCNECKEMAWASIFSREDTYVCDTCKTPKDISIYGPPRTIKSKYRFGEFMPIDKYTNNV